MNAELYRHAASVADSLSALPLINAQIYGPVGAALRETGSRWENEIYKEASEDVGEASSVRGAVLHKTCGRSPFIKGGDRCACFDAMAQLAVAVFEDHNRVVPLLLQDVDISNGRTITQAVRAADEIDLPVPAQ